MPLLRGMQSVYLIFTSIFLRCGQESSGHMPSRSCALLPRYWGSPSIRILSAFRSAQRSLRDTGWPFIPSPAPP